MLQKNKATMYPIDRRKIAKNVYTVLKSLRKSAIVLQCSHTTVSRWLKNIERKVYHRKQTTKSQKVVEVLKMMIQNDPFISILKMKTTIKEVFNFTISSELIRLIIKKSGLSRKKARFFSKPKDLEDKTNSFLQQRQIFLDKSYQFVSIDETSFGRNLKGSYGYCAIGKQLRIQKNIPRVTTISSLAVASKEKLIARKEVQGSFNTDLFCDFLNTLDLEINTVFLLDNVSFHHSKKVKELIESKMWNLLFVPPYSPWFNPIEGIFSIVKRSYYKDGNISLGYQKVTKDHCSAFFKSSFNKELI